jgi:hypothetical protein
MPIDHDLREVLALLKEIEGAMHAVSKAAREAAEFTRNSMAEIGFQPPSAKNRVQALIEFAETDMILSGRGPHYHPRKILALEELLRERMRLVSHPASRYRYREQVSHVWRPVSRNHYWCALGLDYTLRTDGRWTYQGIRPGDDWEGHGTRQVDPRVAPFGQPVSNFSGRSRSGLVNSRILCPIS